MSAPNPWTVVQASDYEQYMGPAGLDQLASLSSLFQESYLAAQPDRVMVLGSATGNGLEHVDPAVTRQVTCVDVNLQYLGIARQRYMHLGPKLELFCSEAEKFRAAAGAYDLVHASLIFEYVHPEVLVRKIAEWLAPAGSLSVVLELPGGGGPEPTSRPLQIIERAEKHVKPAELSALLEHYGLARRRDREVPVPHGRKLWAATFGRAAK
jgi:SAM-dependent methyltransferase